MDTHKRMISGAVAGSGRGGAVRFAGEIPNRPESGAKMIDRRGAKHGKPAFCYEAGFCGYGLHRQIILREIAVIGRSRPKVLSREAGWRSHRFGSDCGGMDSAGTTASLRPRWFRRGPAAASRQTAATP